jgi:hypothetical protein
MKILVQNCLTHLYLKALAEWTHEVSEARSFPNSERAIAFCTEHRIPAVQVVLKFESDRYDINVPISDECEEPGQSQNTLPK